MNIKLLLNDVRYEKLDQLPKTSLPSVQPKYHSQELSCKIKEGARILPMKPKDSTGIDPPFNYSRGGGGGWGVGC